MGISALTPPSAEDIVETVLEFPDNRLLIDLCGEFDRNLAQIEHQMGVHILRRGNRLAVIGDKAAREQAAAVLRSLSARKRIVLHDCVLAERVMAAASAALSAPGASIIWGTPCPASAYQKTDKPGGLSHNVLDASCAVAFHRSKRPGWRSVIYLCPFARSRCT